MGRYLIMTGIAGRWGFGVNNNPILDSPYVHQYDLGFNIPVPPTSEFMITETGIYMIDETTLDRMLTE